MTAANKFSSPYILNFLRRLDCYEIQPQFSSTQKTSIGLVKGPRMVQGLKIQLSLQELNLRSLKHNASF